MKRLLSLCALPIVLAGCQDYLFDQVCPESVREASIVQAAGTPTPADILFIIDNSGSMADEQELLAANFDRFINQIAGAGDYRIAVVTTDQTVGGMDAGEMQGLANFMHANAAPNHLIGIDTQSCTAVAPRIDHGCVRGPDAAKRVIDSNVLTAEEQITAFQQNVRVGSCGSGTEQGLAAMVSALNQRDGCNTGFLRPEANLTVIFVSDEEDASGDPVGDFVNELGNFKPFSQIRVAAIVGSVDGDARNCSTTQAGACGSLCANMPPAGSGTACTPNTCPAGEFCQTNGGMTGVCENEELRYWSNVNCGWCSYYNTADCCSALGGGRYVQFARQIETRVNQADPSVNIANCRGEADTRIACLIDSICQDDFGATLERIAKDLIIRNQFVLDPPASYREGVRVRVTSDRLGGTVDLVYGEDFTVTEDGASLTISGENEPMEGDDVEIYFVIDSENRVEAPRGACAPVQ